MLIFSNLKKNGKNAVLTNSVKSQKYNGQIQNNSYTDTRYCKKCWHIGIAVTFILKRILKQRGLCQTDTVYTDK